MKNRYWYNFYKVGYTARMVSGWCFGETPEEAALDARRILIEWSGKSLKGPATCTLQQDNNLAPRQDPYSIIEFPDVSTFEPPVRKAS
jgi:hypothetical protein